jgi:hypothetical protein
VRQGMEGPENIKTLAARWGANKHPGPTPQVPQKGGHHKMRGV